MNGQRPLALRRVADAGITLIEMLIVLVIIGVATGAATLGLGALARGDAAETEARRLAIALSEGLDAALITGTAQAVEWDGAGYRIGSNAAHVLAGGVTLEGRDGGAVVLSDNAAGKDAVFVLQGDAKAWRVAVAGLSVSVDPVAVP